MKLPDVHDSHALELVKGLIEKNYKTHYSIEWLAEQALMSRSKLIKRYKEYYGMALFEHLQHYRMVMAKRLLDDTGLSIKAIAYQCGFKYPCNFSTAFKQQYGLSPGAYRKLL